MVSGTYAIKEGMKANLRLPKNIAGPLKSGDKIKWIYTGRIEHSYCVDDGRAIIAVTVVENKWIGFGYRRVTFRLSGISDFKNYEELVEEARKAMQSTSMKDVPGIKVCHTCQSYTFAPEIIPQDRKDIPFPFEESLYKVSWT